MNLLHLHRGEYSEGITTDEKVGASAFPETRGGLMAKIQRMDRGTLEVQHAVVFGNQVQISSPACNTSEFGNHLVRVRDGMKHVAAHGEIEAAVRRLEFVNTLMLESQERREIGVALPGKFQIVIHDVDSEHLSARTQFGNPSRAFPRAAALSNYAS